jgi:hypothetical protein
MGTLRMAALEKGKGRLVRLRRRGISHAYISIAQITPLSKGICPLPCWAIENAISLTSWSFLLLERFGVI